MQPLFPKEWQVTPDPPWWSKVGNIIALIVVVGSAVVLLSVTLHAIITSSDAPCPRSPGEETRRPDRIDC